MWNKAKVPDHPVTGWVAESHSFTIDISICMTVQLSVQLSAIKAVDAYSGSFHLVHHAACAAFFSKRKRVSFVTMTHDCANAALNFSAITRKDKARQALSLAGPL